MIEKRGVEKLRVGLNERIVPDYDSYWGGLKLGEYND